MQLVISLEKGIIRIAAPILTILRVITMTTEIKLMVRASALNDNEIVVFDKSAFIDQQELMVAEWTVEEPSSDCCFEKVLRFVFESLGHRLNSYKPWLLIGNTAWRPDTRVARYRKLFNSLAASGINFEGVAERCEELIEQDGKIKFFGAVRLDESVLSLVPQIMSYRSSTYIAVMPDGEEGSLPITEGWSGQWSKDSSLVRAISNRRGVLLQRTGFFDDPECGLIAIGPAQVLGRIAACS
jgi:hypothetical protein